MKHLCSLLALIPGVLCAQDKPADASASSPGLSAYTKIEAAYQADVKRYRAELTAQRKTPAFQKAMKDRDRSALAELRKDITMVDTAAFAEQFKAHAEKFSGKDAAAKSLTWVAFNSGRDKDAVRDAVDMLLADYLESKELRGLAENAGRMMRTLGKDGVRELVDEIIAETPHTMVRAYALFSRANIIAPRRAKVSDEDRALAAKDLAEVARMAKGSILAMRAEAPKFQKERLQIGMEVPDIIGNDTDGVEFKLSDYRGKVVVLDFWGDW